MNQWNTADFQYITFQLIRRTLCFQASRVNDIQHEINFNEDILSMYASVFPVRFLYKWIDCLKKKAQIFLQSQFSFNYRRYVIFAYEYIFQIWKFGTR